MRGCRAPRRDLATSRGDILKQRAAIDQLEWIAEAEEALANATDSALALVNIAETISGDRRFILQQVSWSIQNELATLSEFLRAQKENASLAASPSDRATVVQLDQNDTGKAKRDV